MSEAALLWRQYRLERRMFWRNPSAAFFNFLLPLLFLALFGAIFADRQADLDVIVPGIAGLCIMSTTFSALAFNMTYLREAGILKRMRGTPLPGPTYLGGLILSAITNALITLAVILLAGVLLFGIGWPESWPMLALFTLVGVTCFASLGIALSHAIPSFESAPAYVNAIFLPMIFISGVFYDAENAPRFLRSIAEALPLKHLIDGYSAAMVTGRPLSELTGSLAVLGLWGAVGAVLAIRGFSWDRRGS
jgi:ABC-2 type transport system permease protein